MNTSMIMAVVMLRDNPEVKLCISMRFGNLIVAVLGPGNKVIAREEHCLPHVAISRTLAHYRKATSDVSNDV